MLSAEHSGHNPLKRLQSSLDECRPQVNVFCVELVLQQLVFVNVSTPEVKAEIVAVSHAYRCELSPQHTTLQESGLISTTPRQ